MSGLAEFVRARFDEDAAEIAKQPDGEGEPGGIGIWATGDALSNTEYLVIGKARALADVEAKRAIAREHGPSHKHTTVWDWPDVGKWCGECGAEPCRQLNSCVICGDDDGCRTLRLLALSYAGHPDHRDEWLP